MENIILIKERLKERIKNNYFDIKNQSGDYRLYTLVLNRVYDLETIFFPLYGTLINLKKQIDDTNLNYSTVWNASKLDITNKKQIPVEKKIIKKLKKISHENVDFLLIECLIELKNEGFFDSEIPEFSIYIQHTNKNTAIEENSFKLINGTSYWNAFKSREIDNDYSLTNLLIDRYNL